MREWTEYENTYVCMTRMWIILADHYGCPKNTPLPDLHMSSSAMAIAENELAKWTISRCVDWLEGEDEMPISKSLELALDNMWEEVSNA